MKEIILVGGISRKIFYEGGETGKNANLLAAFTDCGCRVVPASLLKLSKHPWRGLITLYKLLTHPHANVFIASSLRRCGWLIKLLYYVNSSRNICYAGTGCQFSGLIAKGKFNAKYFRNITTIIVQGESMKRELATVGLDAIVLPNFKRMNFLPTLPDRSLNEMVRFVFMSRMNEKKGVNLIIECCNRLNNDGYGDKYVVDFYGSFESKEYKNIVMDKIALLKNVLYCGKLNMGEEDGYNTLAQYNVMLFPTFWPGEGFPGVLIDALMAGLPVIASDWHFNSDIVQEGLTGKIIKSQDEDALYEAMIDVIKNPNKYHNMASYCQNQASNYDTKNIINIKFLQRIGFLEE